MLVIAIVSGSVPSLYIGRDALLLGFAFVVAGSMACHFVLEKLAGEHVLQTTRHCLRRRPPRRSLMQKQASDNLGGFKTVGFIPAWATSRAPCRPKGASSCARPCSSIARDSGLPRSSWPWTTAAGGFPFDAFLECRLAGIAATDLTEFLERETGKVRLDLVHPNWMVFSEGFRRNSLQSNLERTFDILASLALLALTWPLMLLTIAAIKVEDGPVATVLYGQIRVGRARAAFPALQIPQYA